MTATIGIGTLKERLVDLVNRAQAGEVIVVTHRGRPVAQRGPVAGRSEPHIAAQPLDWSKLRDLDLDEPAFASWERDEGAA